MGTTGSGVMSIQQDKIAIIAIFTPALFPLLRHVNLPECVFMSMQCVF